MPILPQTEHTALVAIRDRAEPHVLLTSNSIDKADSTFVLEGFWNPAKYLLDKLDIQWQLKKIIYRADVARFNEILNNNNVKYSIDILKDHGAFRRELLGPLHPDKVGNSKDFLFINALREKFKDDINVQEVAQEFLYRQLQD